MAEEVRSPTLLRSAVCKEPISKCPKCLSVRIGDVWTPVYNNVLVFDQWTLLLDDVFKVFVEGTIPGGFKMGPYPVAKRLKNSHLVSSGDEGEDLFILRGKLVTDNLPLFIASAFKKGFPENWEELLDEWKSRIFQEKLAESERLLDTAQSDSDFRCSPMAGTDVVLSDVPSGCTSSIFDQIDPLDPPHYRTFREMEMGDEDSMQHSPGDSTKSVDSAFGPPVADTDVVLSDVTSGCTSSMFDQIDPLDRLHYRTFREMEMGVEDSMQHSPGDHIL